jgi:hypothetical protein
MADLFEFTGIETLRQRLENIAATVTSLAGIALQQEADAILEVSQGLVPVDTGALRASGAVLDVVIRGPVVESGVTYGGDGPGFERTPRLYAVFVEFNVTMRHPRGGQAHYLSQPTFAAVNGMAERLAEQLRNAF